MVRGGQGGRLTPKALTRPPNRGNSNRLNLPARCGSKLDADGGSFFEAESQPQQAGPDRDSGGEAGGE